jgi:hypothetical protein
VHTEGNAGRKMSWWESDKIVHLEITSLVGTISFGVHYYGKLCGGYAGKGFATKRFSVTKKLTKAEAKGMTGEAIQRIKKQ